MEKIIEILPCPVAYTIGELTGKWKFDILWRMMKFGTLRYGELKKTLSPITEKMLIQTLKTLEMNGFVNRKSYPMIPPHVEYSLTEKGQNLRPVMEAMMIFGKSYMNKNTGESL